MQIRQTPVNQPWVVPYLYVALPSRSPQGKANQRKILFFGNASHQANSVRPKIIFYFGGQPSQPKNRDTLCLREPPLCGGLFVPTYIYYLWFVP